MGQTAISVPILFTLENKTFVPIFGVTVILFVNTAFLQSHFFRLIFLSGADCTGDGRVAHGDVSEGGVGAGTFSVELVTIFISSGSDGIGDSLTMVSTVGTSCKSEVAHGAVGEDGVGGGTFSAELATVFISIRSDGIGYSSTLVSTVRTSCEGKDAHGAVGEGGVGCGVFSAKVTAFLISNKTAFFSLRSVKY